MLIEHVPFFPVEKSVSEVPNNTLNLWEEGRVEDELSPEEIQMVRHLKHHYTFYPLNVFFF